MGGFIEEYLIDIDSLRKDLKDYFGTAMFNVSMFAMIDLINVDKLNDEEVINLALKNGFNLNNYVIDKKNKNR